ncbi:hypothetical protein BKA65DRAFT_552315 [Rhexocercosporidium sp. MPI-PUGE-AT-0058]|nr:hypothetical protein BKA65DRAFT_552315 [Rhexocercosporidium sp. MPI-PUGE-AT-0058]
MPRKIRPPFQKIIHPPVSPASIKVYQAARSRYPNENLRAKLSLLSHALDIPYFNLLDMTIADRIKKAKTELKEWMNTTDTIALSINMPDYIEMLEVKVSRQRLIGDSIKSVIQLLPFNIKTLLIILDYNDSDAPQHLSDIDYTNEPQLQYIQDEVFRIVSAGALSNRFRAQYKAGSDLVATQACTTSTYLREFLAFIMRGPKAIKKEKAGKLPDASEWTPLPQDPSEYFEKSSQSPLTTTPDNLTADDCLSVTKSIDSPTTISIDASLNNIITLESLPKSNEASTLKSGWIFTAVAALSEPLTEFTLFPKLPLELRYKIINLALVPQAVYISRSAPVVGRQVISLACKEFKEEYERQYKIIKKRNSYLRPRFGPIFINYSIDFVHFFHTSVEDKTTWAGVMATKFRRGCDLFRWMKPAQRVAVRLRQRGGNRGLCAPKAMFGSVWEKLSGMCPEMKELVFIIAHRKFPKEDLVELRGFGGQIGAGERALRKSFKAAQLRGFNVSAKLMVMGAQKDWVVSKGKIVEIVDMSG